VFRAFVLSIFRGKKSVLLVFYLYGNPLNKIGVFYW
jgi:hypothetical protein